MMPINAYRYDTIQVEQWAICIIALFSLAIVSCNNFETNCEVIESHDDGSPSIIGCHNPSTETITYCHIDRNSDTIGVGRYRIINSNELHPILIKTYLDDTISSITHFDSKDTSKYFNFSLYMDKGYKQYEYMINDRSYYTKRVDLDDSLLGVHLSPQFEIIDEDLFDKLFVFKVDLPIPDSLKLHQGVMLHYKIFYKENKLCVDSMRILSNEVDHSVLHCDPNDFKELYSLGDTVKLEFRTEIETNLFRSYTTHEFISILN